MTKSRCTAAIRHASNHYTAHRATPSLSRPCLITPNIRILRDSRPGHSPSYPLTSRHRTFTTSPTHHGGRQAAHSEPQSRRRNELRSAKFHERDTRMRLTKTPSRYAQLREMVRNDEIPDDLGVLEGTLIMPTGAALPSFFQSPQLRLKMEYQRANRRVRDWLTVMAFKYSMGFWKYKVRFGRTAPTAMALHRQLYQALADGDRHEIADIAAEGLKKRLVDKVRARPDDVVLFWDLVRYIGRPRVVSHRASAIPLQEGETLSNYVRQAVVKVTSLQKLTRSIHSEEREDEGERNWEPPAETEKQVTEYVVVQKWCNRGNEGDWKVWGTVEETPVEKFDEVANMTRAQSRAMNETL